MKRTKTEFIEELAIEQVAAEGKGIARRDNFVVFVERAIPGDIVNVKITKKKKDYAQAEIVSFVKKSENRIVAFCSHFGLCGGCKWQDVLYAEQLREKEQLVYDALRRIGKIDVENISPIIGCAQTEHYRNKVEFTFSDRAWLTDEQIKSGLEFDRRALGFHVPQSFSGVLAVSACYLMDDKQNEIRNAVFEFAKQEEMAFYNLKTHEGLLRNLIFRNTSTGEWMLTVCFAAPVQNKIDQLMSFICNKFPEITSLNYIINQKLNDTIYDQEVINYAGQDFITEQLDEIRYKISVKSFFQTNSLQAKVLYDIVKNFGQFSKDEIVYDLYCGTGSIALYVANSCKQVIGIEQIAQAVLDADENAKLNHINNASFYTGTCEAIFSEDFLQKHPKADTIIVDPPRAGLHEKVVDTLLKSEAKKIVYVSCNPSTQARDILLLSEKYALTKCQPVDMFPHTFHIENVVLLEKR